MRLAGNDDPLAAAQLERSFLDARRSTSTSPCSMSSCTRERLTPQVAR
jgi:hypothetical protein